MRALKMEDLEFVAGGFGLNGPEPKPVETVTVPGVRRKPPGVDPLTWNVVAGNEERFQDFCNALVGA